MSYEFDPYKNMRPTPEFRDTRGIYHNAQGFRREDPTSLEKPQDTLRIFVMGGSTAYGLESLSRFGAKKYPIIRNDETIDHYLEQYLRKRFPSRRIEVINAAITSHQSHHHLIYLNQTILKYHPDMVIFIDGFNDYFNYTKGFDQFRDYAYQERAYAFLHEPSFSALARFTGWWLFRKSHAVHLAGRAARNVWYAIRGHDGRAHIDVDEAIGNLRENAENNFVKMIERNSMILQHEGAQAVFTLQPEIAFEQRKKFSDLEKQIYAEMNEYWQENLIEFKNRARPIVIEYMKNATSEFGAEFIDLTDIYGDVEGDVFTDYCHLTPIGNRVLADYVGERVLPMLETRVDRINGD